MTKRRRRTQRSIPKARTPRLQEQARCSDCGRWRLKADACWFCDPAWPDPCLCDATVIRYEVDGEEHFLPHLHLDHTLLLHISQVLYETIDETILLPSDWMPAGPDEVLVPDDEETHGIGMALEPQQAAEGHRAAGLIRPTYRRQRGPWWEEPRLRARLATFPELTRIARGQGIDGLFAWAGFTDREADAYAMDAAGYTVEAIAERMRLKPGGVENLLDSARGKVALALARMERKSA